MNPKNRKNSQVLVMVLGAAFVLTVIVIALGSGGGGTTIPGAPSGGASSPITVNQEVVAALQQNDAQAFYEQLSPAMKEVFTEQDMITGQQESDSQKGQITNVEVLQEPQLLSGSQWNNEWAEGRIRVTRGATSQDYLARYHLENGEWWLFGTIPVP
jgi:hypothetical protein